MGSGIGQRIKRVPRRWVWFGAAVAVVGLMVFARREEPEQGVPLDYDPETVPTMLTREAMSLISDSGYIRYKIEAPVWYVFDEAAEPNWKFNEGLYIEQFDDSMKVAGTFRCDSAVYKTNLKMWQFTGNVRMHNVAGDRFLTQLLYWDENARKISSDSFIHIEKSDRIIEGYGFESDDRIENYTVSRPTMIIPFSDFNRRPAEPTTATPPSKPEADAAPAPKPAQTRQSATAVGKRVDSGELLIKDRAVMKLPPDNQHPRPNRR